MENKQNKPRLKFNIFDVIIIAVVIVAACALIFIWRNSGKSGSTAITKPVHYTITLDGMASGSSGKIKEGDTIMDTTKKFIMGTVVSVEIAPATSPAKNLETGDTVLSEIPGKETATIELVCNCSSTDAEITAESGYLIRIGNEITASGPGYAGKGYVVAIERGDLG